MPNNCTRQRLWGFIANTKAGYRLFLHPLSKIPGPWYAAVSSFYEFWHDCIKEGRYFVKIEEMHEKYGPVIRINPYEVHINDPAFFDTIYSNSQMHKVYRYYRGLGVDTGTVSSISAQQHRLRRGALAQFFSGANVKKLEHRVLSRVEQFCGRVEEYEERNMPIQCFNAYRSFATDVVTDYAVPKTRNFLAEPDFNAKVHGILRNAGRVICWNRHFPIITPIIRWTALTVPPSWIASLDPSGASLDFIENQADLLSQAQAAVNGDYEKETPTVIGALVKNPSLPPSERSYARIADETVTVIAAGTETTGNTLTILTYHILANPSVHKALKGELTKAASKHGMVAPGMLTSKIVYSLPYLQGCVKEGLRMASGVSGRLPRCHPTESLSYTTPEGKQYVFRPGTALSMFLHDVHFSTSIFPEPNTFDPNRWLTGSPEMIAHLEKHLVPFGKGVRQCVALELAKQEIILMIANLFWKFDLELFETTERDIAYEHDYFSSFAGIQSKGVRIVAKSSVS
ncbi:putative cytochrome P450 [Dendryphion nanum]|uniref:Cytochrome P450 n=1 Tax=Dendryphion nanum TaxID=256645 RepID=A0A9P9EJT7_9PLEO|nr:putative cytochrome P450 [Dendryphion nanum]